MTAGGRASSALSFPVARGDGGRVWLTAGQRLLLFYVYRRVRGAGPATLAAMAAATSSSRGLTSRRLDRLAALGLIGRRSLRGRGHVTHLWIPGAARRAASWGPRRGAPLLRVRNVATSTPFGGYLSREGLAAAWRGRIGGPPVAAAPRRGASRRARREPPRLLYGRCPAGHRVRLLRHRWTLTSTALEGEWRAVCRRCDRLAVERVSVELPAPPAVGSEAWRQELVARHGPVRVSAVLDGLSWSRAPLGQPDRRRDRRSDRP